MALSSKLRPDHKEVEAVIEAHVHRPRYICSFARSTRIHFEHLPSSAATREFSDALTGSLVNFTESFLAGRSDVAFLVPFEEVQDIEAARIRAFSFYFELQVAADRSCRTGQDYESIRRGVHREIGEILTYPDARLPVHILDVTVPHLGRSVKQMMVTFDPNYSQFHPRHLPHAAIQVLPKSTFAQGRASNIQQAESIAKKAVVGILYILFNGEQLGFSPEDLACEVDLLKRFLHPYLRGGFDQLHPTLQLNTMEELQYKRQRDKDVQSPHMQAIFSKIQLDVLAAPDFPCTHAALRANPALSIYHIIRTLFDKQNSFWFKTFTPPQA